MKDRLKKIAGWIDENSTDIGQVLLGASVAYLAYVGIKQQKFNQDTARATLTLIEIAGPDEFKDTYDSMIWK